MVSPTFTAVGAHVTERAHQPTGQVEHFPKTPSPKGVSDQLGQIRDTLSSEFPQASAVTLDFDGALHAHIDVRDGHDIPIVEARLAGMCGGIFSKVRHGASPNHPFQHRISMVIER